MTVPLFKINPALDRAALREKFARDGRVQVRDFLMADAAATIRDILEHQTRWGFSWQAGTRPNEHILHDDLVGLAPERSRDIAAAVAGAASRGEYAVRFKSYPILDAYRHKWDPGSPHDLLIEHINDQPFLDLAREVCAIPELRKADAQATLFAPGDFLGLHTDSHVAEGWRVAYVMNFADPDWRTDWGGYLNFYNDEGDVIEGWKPRFNALNLLRVPCPHAVSYVPHFAPVRRYAITGWLRDR